MTTATESKPAAEVWNGPTPKQWQVIRTIKARSARLILTGGAISTAKSYGLAIVILSMARQFKGSRYGVFRKNRVVLRRTTYQTFKKVAYLMGLHAPDAAAKGSHMPAVHSLLVAATLLVGTRDVDRHAIHSRLFALDRNPTAS